MILTYSFQVVVRRSKGIGDCLGGTLASKLVAKCFGRRVKTGLGNGVKSLLVFGSLRFLKISGLVVNIRKKVGWLWSISLDRLDNW